GFDAGSVDVISLSTRSRKTLLRGGAFGRYLPSGHLTYVSRGTLFTVPFDLQKMEVRGVPYPILDHVAFSGRMGFARLDFSAAGGTLVYRSGSSADPLVTVQWLDEHGRTQPLLARPGYYYYPRVSADGERIAMTMTDRSNSDL